MWIVEAIGMMCIGFGILAVILYFIRMCVQIDEIHEKLFEEDKKED